MYRILVLLVLISTASWADVPYRKKLLTVADIKAYLPKGFKIDPVLEEFDTQSYGKFEQYDYKYKQQSVLYLKSSWAARPNSALASDEYSKILMVIHLLPTAEANWSKLVRVGDESICLRLKGGRIYTLGFRRGAVVGYFTLGLERKMSPKELESIAKSWIRRAR